MTKIYRVPVGFAAVLQRLGIRSPDVAFDLADTVIPVSIVDPDPLSANALPPTFASPASNGEAAYGAGARLADTGALAAGNWYFKVMIISLGGVYQRIGRRNAADAAYVWSQKVGSGATNITDVTFRCSMLAGERLVIEQIAASGSIDQGSIFAALT